MVRDATGKGAVLRPNSSLAGVEGSSAFASGGNGSGLRVPLSCAAAEPAAIGKAASRKSVALKRFALKAKFASEL